MRLMKACSTLIVGICLLLLWSHQANALEVPEYVFSPPAGHYSGVSEPTNSLSAAKRSAVLDVVRQVMETIGMQYDYRSIHSAQGSPGNPGRFVDDRISWNSNGYVAGVQEAIVESSYSVDERGRYVYFVLVEYGRADVERMRKLSIGAKVSASVVRVSHGLAVIRVSESSGIPVVVNCADVQLHKKNRFAKTISYFVMKVPNGSSASYKVGVGPVTVSDSSAEVKVPISGKGLEDYLLGSSMAVNITLSGVDEVGRAVRASVSF